jgi:hypothetical protein
MTSLRFHIGMTAEARIGGSVLAVPFRSGLAS